MSQKRFLFVKMVSAIVEDLKSRLSSFDTGNYGEFMDEQLRNGSDQTETLGLTYLKVVIFI